MPTPPLKNTPPEKPAARPLAHSSSTLWLLGVLALVLMFLVCNHQLGGVSEISYGMFRKQLDKSPPNIAKVEVQGTAVAGEFVTPPPDPSGKKDRNGHDVMLERKFVTSLPAGPWSTATSTTSCWRKWATTTRWSRPATARGRC